LGTIAEHVVEGGIAGEREGDVAHELGEADRFGPRASQAA
jgi:hypothetical protein